MPRLSGCEAGNAAKPEQREGHGNLRALGQCANLFHRARFRDAVAGENHGTLGVADQLGGLRETLVFNRSMGCGR